MATRLDKLLASAGVGSRSEVKEYIRAGRVRVGGEPVRAADVAVSDGDEVTFDGRPVSTAKYRYFLMNKPAGVITSTEEGHDRTVMDILPAGMPKGLAPVGRLDRDTVGLLLLTNDGELAHRLLSPKHHCDKTYRAITDGIPSPDGIISFETGIEFKDFTSEPAKLEIVSTDPEKGTCEALVTLHEGKFHQVKRMFAAIGCEVTYLKRESFGPFRLPAELAEGAVTEVTADRDALMSLNK